MLTEVHAPQNALKITHSQGHFYHGKFSGDVGYILPMKETEETSEIYRRIKQRLDEVGMSERQASIKAVGNSQFIRNIRKGSSSSPRGENIIKLARVLDVSEAWLLGVSDEPGAATKPSPFGVRFGGIVEAGNFRPDDGLNQSNEWRFIPVPPDPRYPQSSQYAFEVRGDSMDKAHVVEGMWAVAVDVETWERLHGQVPSGKLVVVAKTRNGDPERELTVKRLRYFRDRMELQPESTNPSHEPLAFPLPLGEDTLQHIRIIAVVLQSTWVHG